MATLRQCRGVKKRAAEILGISLKTLYNKLGSYGESAKSRPAAAESSPVEELKEG